MEEAKVLESLGKHKNIVEFKFISQYSNYILMGMEFAKDGTLLDLIRNIHKTKKYLSDQNCSRIIKSILKGL